MHDPEYLAQISALPNVCDPRRPKRAPTHDPIERGDPRVLGFFTLEPENAAFLAGQQSHLARPGLWGSVFSAAGMILAALLTLLTGREWGITGFGLLALIAVWLGLAALAGSGAIRLLRENHHYETAGQLLAGSVSRAEGRWLTAYSGNSWADNRRFEATIHYRFTGPDGTRWEGWRSALRHDLTPEALPAPGAPVAVYFLDPAHFRLL